MTNPESRPPATPMSDAPLIHETHSTAESHAPIAPPTSGDFRGTGRRKAAVARVRIRPGAGKFMINAAPMDKYFSELQDRNAVLAPLVATSTVSSFNINVSVHGGGHTGQAGAIRLGVARALLRANTQYEPALRAGDFLTRDARKVERKKPGRRKARRSFQFSKR